MIIEVTPIDVNGHDSAHHVLLVVHDVCALWGVNHCHYNPNFERADCSDWMNPAEV
jgi:hypothetical protein